MGQFIWHLDLHNKVLRSHLHQPVHKVMQEHLKKPCPKPLLSFLAYSRRLMRLSEILSMFIKLLTHGTSSALKDPKCCPQTHHPHIIDIHDTHHHIGPVHLRDSPTAIVFNFLEEYYFILKAASSIPLSAALLLLNIFSLPNSIAVDSMAEVSSIRFIFFSWFEEFRSLSDVGKVILGSHHFVYPNMSSLQVNLMDGVEQRLNIHNSGWWILLIVLPCLYQSISAFSVCPGPISSNQGFPSTIQISLWCHHFAQNECSSTSHLSILCRWSHCSSVLYQTELI